MGGTGGRVRVGIYHFKIKKELTKKIQKSFLSILPWYFQKASQKQEALSQFLILYMLPQGQNQGLRSVPLITWSLG